MPKIKITDTRGLEQTTGTGVEIENQLTLGAVSSSATVTKGNMATRQTLCFIWIVLPGLFLFCENFLF